MKIVIALILLSISACAHPTKAETFRNASGQVIGRSSTDARGNTTFYNPLGQQTGRSVTNGNGTTFYNPMGQITGRSTGRR